MDVQINPGCLHGTVRAIPSKSQAHRALISAALADRPTRIICTGYSEDIWATSDCLRALGADIRREAYGFSVEPLDKSARVGSVTLRCGESGSTFRFLLPLVCALGRDASFLTQGRLAKRPLSPLYETLIAFGAGLSPQGSDPFCVSGQLAPGNYALSAGVSSQFISGLLFSLPLLDGDSELRLLGEAESFPYIELTMAMLKTFDVRISFDGKTFTIPGNQIYKSPDEVFVEGDWSNAAFWLSAGALGADGVACAGLDLASRQGDRAILDILSRFGAEVETSGDTAAVVGGNLRGIEIDARDTPDLVPIAAVVGALAEGRTIIRNAERLRGKESDRLAAMSETLRALGADITETGGGLDIRGRALNGGEVSSWGDHRIAMSAAIAATVSGAPVLIRGAEAVNKSYPGFFDDFKALGGDVTFMN